MNQEQWKKEVLQSLEGLESARPPADLFTQIQARIGQADRRPIPLGRVRLAVACTLLLLLVNGLSLRYYLQQSVGANSEAILYESSLFSDYNLYE